MEAIFVCRDKIASIYKNCEFLFKILAKFIFAFLTLSYLTNNLGYYDVLNIMSIRLFLSVVCAFIPVSFVVLVMGLVAVLHLVKLSMILGALSAVVFLIIYFLYLRFAPAQGIFMLAVAVLSPFHLHYAVAFVLGMVYSPVTLIPVGLTIVLMRFVQCVVQAAPIIGDSFEMEVILAGYQSVIDGLMDDKSMILLIAALAIIIVLTYIISQMPFDYSWYVAIAVAAIVNIVVIIAGNGIPGSEYSVNGYAEQRVCLEPTEVGWEVYIGERGQKYDLTTHRALDDACKQMFVELADSVSLRDRMIFEFTRHVALKKRNAARKADTMKGYSKKSQD